MSCFDNKCDICGCDLSEIERNFMWLYSLDDDERLCFDCQKISESNIDELEKQATELEKEYKKLRNLK
jgi:hypothetical protein